MLNWWYIKWPVGFKGLTDLWADNRPTWHIVIWKWNLRRAGIYLGMLHIFKNNGKYLVASLYALVTRKHYTKCSLKLNTASRLRLEKTSYCERDIVFVLVTRVLASCWRTSEEASWQEGRPCGRIAGIIPQILQLHAQITLTSLGWCRKLG